MENSTKIYIGVGAAALVAFLLFRNKAAAQKPAGTGGTTKDCPTGQTRVQPKCIKAPCPSYCESNIIPQFPVKDSGNDYQSYEEYMTYGGNDTPKVCPEGTRPCQNNPNKCVSTNPNINYIVDPCSKEF
jgi:hypothetical protein